MNEKPVGPYLEDTLVKATADTEIATSTCSSSHEASLGLICLGIIYVIIQIWHNNESADIVRYPWEGANSI